MLSAEIKELLSSHSLAFTLIIGFSTHPAEKITHKNEHATSYGQLFLQNQMGCFCLFSFPLWSVLKQNVMCLLLDESVVFNVLLMRLCACFLLGCTNPEELTAERVHSAVEKIFKTLRGLSSTRNHLKQLRSIYTASDGVHQVGGTQTLTASLKTHVTGVVCFTRIKYEHYHSFNISQVNTEYSF